MKTANNDIDIVKDTSYLPIYRKNLKAELSFIFIHTENNLWGRGVCGCVCVCVRGRVREYGYTCESG